MKISRKKTKYLAYNEHQDAEELHLRGETVKRVKTFTYPGSTLAEDGELDAEVTRRLHKSGVSVVRQENEREDQGEGVQDCGKTSTDVRGRDMGSGEIAKKVQERRLKWYGNVMRREDRGEGREEGLGEDGWTE